MSRAARRWADGSAAERQPSDIPGDHSCPASSCGVAITSSTIASTGPLAISYRSCGIDGAPLNAPTVRRTREERTAASPRRSAGSRSGSSSWTARWTSEPGSEPTAAQPPHCRPAFSQTKLASTVVGYRQEVASVASRTTRTQRGRRKTPSSDVARRPIDRASIGRRDVTTVRDTMLRSSERCRP